MSIDIYLYQTRLWIDSLGIQIELPTWLILSVACGTIAYKRYKEHKENN